MRISEADILKRQSNLALWVHAHYVPTGVETTRRVLEPQKSDLITRMNPLISLNRSQPVDVTKHFKSDRYRLAALAVDRAALVLKWLVWSLVVGGGGVYLLMPYQPASGPAAARPALMVLQAQPERVLPTGSKIVVAASEQGEPGSAPKGESKPKSEPQP